MAAEAFSRTRSPFRFWGRKNRNEKRKKSWYAQNQRAAATAGENPGRNWGIFVGNLYQMEEEAARDEEYPGSFGNGVANGGRLGNERTLGAARPPPVPFKMPQGPLCPRENLSFSPVRETPRGHTLRP
ncbi:hypothetical protein GWK47_023269 [Chionoecetes opilio]|uniref:Uncharacterized protein n=1 Tax=Chionoecetes opilio TaxID=41210 RepID=A0A8J4XPP4_CHIOP|nr:hypothetical protein GWK47_023269 [Chionoecetes opilio]